jgi:hypothetical protein
VTGEIGRQEDVISEDITPSNSPVLDSRGKPVGTHDQLTRKHIAMVVLISLGLLYAASFAFFLLGLVDIEHFTTVMAAVSAPQAIAATVAGFYYGDAGRKS